MLLWKGYIFISLWFPDNSDEPRSFFKRDLKDNQIQDKEDVIGNGNIDVISDLMGLEGEFKCKARLFSCLGNVAKGSMHYMNEPGGVTGYVKSFKIYLFNTCDLISRINSVLQSLAKVIC